LYIPSNFLIPEISLLKKQQDGNHLRACRSAGFPRRPEKFMVILKNLQFFRTLFDEENLLT